MFATARGASTKARGLDTSGFTLVEVLVAFAVMAVVLSAMFRGVTAMRKGSIAFDGRTRQEAVAQALLDREFAQRDATSIRRSGIRNGIRWTVTTKTIDLSGQMPPRRSGETVRAPTGQTEPQPRGRKNVNPEWVPQRLTLRVDGMPVPIETIRLSRVGTVR